MKKLIDYIRINFNEYHFIFLWTLLNIFQISTTELTSDEGYYWFYSSRLEWGYYDHPPLLALLIKLGGLLFSGETGVRLFNVLLMSVALVFLFRIIKWTKRDKNYITFIAFPDTPLVALSIVSLYAYKNFTDKSNLATSSFFGISIALMLYSKYHAVIFVFFILLSNLKLLKNRYFYFSIVLAVLLFIPHLLWQYHHGFPSFQYHLSGRASQFSVGNIIQYVTQQIPMIGFGIIFIPFIYRPENQFEKTLRYICLGTLIFFLFSTLRGFVHLHWTSILLFPVIILSARYYSAKNTKRLFNFLVIPFLILILAARIYLAFPILSLNTLHVDYYHGRKLWAEDIKAVASDKPVIFETGNSGLREAPLYSFYSKGLAIALYPGENKKSQYQIWNYEDSVQSKNIILIKNEPFEGSRVLRTRMGKTVHYREIDNFTSFNNIKIRCNEEDIDYEKDSIKIAIQIINHRKSTLHFNNNHKVFIAIRNKEDNEFTFEQTLNNVSIKAVDSVSLHFSFSINDIGEGDHEFILGMTDGFTDPSINSQRYKLYFRQKMK
jgi:hypothetical protein